jgi:glycosyltransferase involved in cell wall biosynthesis
MKIDGNKVLSMKPGCKLKVAHFAYVAPNQAGIAGTAIDMVLAERTAGIDSQVIDFQGNGKPCRVGLEYRGVKTVGPSWAQWADVIVRHSAVPQPLKNSGKPIIMCLHGRPEYGFLLQYYKRMNLLGEWFKCAADPHYRTFITFWKEHLDYLNIMMPNSKIDYVPAMVDTKNFKPSGIRYDYDIEGGTPNILIADMFREDANPFNVLVAASVFIRKYCPEARVHIYGLQRTNESPVKDLIEKMKDALVIGEASALVTKMERIYRSADMVVTPHRIATRVIREALASGAPVVAGQGCPYTQYTADARDAEGFAAKINECWNDIQKSNGDLRQASRAMAEKSFNLEQAGKAALEVYERVLNEPKPVIEVRTKPMIYNFIVYTTEQEGKDIGAAYNRYMKLLPNDEDWACFIDHDAMWTTRDWFKQLGSILLDNPEYGLLSVCTNRIGNSDQKLSGFAEESNILRHRVIGKQLFNQEGTKVKDVTDMHRISGVVMLIRKDVWKKAGGFMSGFLGVDNDMHSRVAKAGFKVGIMRGIYVYHWYRQGDSDLPPALKQ